MTRFLRGPHRWTGVGLPLGIAGVCWLAFGLWHAATLYAHSQTTTLSEVGIAGSNIEWTLRVRSEDLVEPLGLPETAGPTDILAAREPALAYVGSRVNAATGAHLCQRTAQTMGVDVRGGTDVASIPADGSHDIRFTFGFHCDADTAPVTLHYQLFFDLDPLHTGFALVSLNDHLSVTHLFRAGSETLTVSGRAESWWRQGLQYLALGIEHIFLGYDHLAFLAALILGTVLSRRGSAALPPEAASQRQALLRTVEIVTAFTVGHSITLIYAALQPGGVGAGWVEPAIALSVAYVAFENLRPKVAGWRWLLALGFGLVHGFGFASVLHEIGLPATGSVRSLLAFNLGVEFGQIAVVAACLPILLALARRDPARFEAWGVRAASAAIGVAGLWWFVARVI